MRIKEHVWAVVFGVFLMADICVMDACTVNAQEADYDVPIGFMDYKPGVSYGDVIDISYYSDTTESTRKAKVILPADYSEEKEYPVLYLLHGIGGDQTSLYNDKVEYVIGNMMAEGTSEEMIVVLPNVCANKTGLPPAGLPFFSLEHYQAYDNFLNDLIVDLMPYVEDHFSVKTEREDTAVAGFSMGGRIALYIGFSYPDMFGYIGGFCPAPGMLPYTFNGVTEEGYYTEDTFTLPEEYMENTLVEVMAGTADTVVVEYPATYHDALEKNEVPHIWYKTKGGDAVNVGDGGHNAPVYKHGLYNFMKEMTVIIRANEQEEIDRQAADEVKRMISAIGEVQFSDTCNTRIEAARNAYEQLTDEQKNLVDNYDVLLQAEETYELLRTDVVRLFADVSANDWFVEYVRYVYAEGIMTGLNNTEFGPNDRLARAQFAVIIHRMNGAPEISYKDTFKDVPDDIWYTDAILWANSIGVVTGYTDSGLFGPGDYINREQIAVMMYRYAAYKKYDVTVDADMDQFADVSCVSDYAWDAMEWAVGKGVITGKNNGTVLDPQGNATRAECAAVIQRFIKLY